MIVDTSAVIAILTAEDDAATYARAIADASVRRLSAASYLECGIVLDNQRDPVISRSLDELLAEAEFVIELLAAADAVIIEFGQGHWRAAVSAWGRFGKGRHPAGLNFGDCLSYALALDTREPLLWKGDDFGHTGIASALTL